jgi:hypothetical protein
MMKMTQHIDELLPFYVNQTLNEEDIALVQLHLKTCAECRQELELWGEIADVTAAVDRLAVPSRLSPLVHAGLSRRPSLRQAAASALHLIWSQRVFIAGSWLLPSVGSLIGCAALIAIFLIYQAEEWVNVPLFAIVPVGAALITAFLYTFEDDPASELIAATPTSLATLLFARLSLALSAVSLMGFIGSLLAALLGNSLHSLFALIGVWLGPMLLLSALTTVFSLILHPRVASGAALALWGGLLILLFAEQTGSPLLKVSLLWLVRPDWAVFAGHVLLAGLLWMGTWYWLGGHPPAHMHSEGGV